jgi:hypothetical protein
VKRPVPDRKCVRANRHTHADYRPLDRLARHRINIKLIIEQWEDILRVAGSLSTGTVRASELMRVLQGGGRQSRLGRAVAELGRVAKTLHLLSWIDREEHRRQFPGSPSFSTARWSKRRRPDATPSDWSWPPGDARKAEEAQVIPDVAGPT